MKKAEKSMTQNEIDEQIAMNVSWAYTRFGLVVGWTTLIPLALVLVGMLAGLCVLIWKGVFYLHSCT